MAFTKITHAGIGSTGTVLLENLEVTGVGTFGGSVSVGGTLTYEDVTNIDSVGIITARAGVLVGSGITLSKDGDVFFTGIATGNGSGLTALNASNISSGTVPTARLGSGTASSSTFLRGDSTFQTVNTDLVSDTTPQLGGNLDVNTKNILFGDSSDGSSDDVLKFGAGSDLKLYHTGTNSYITNTTNILYLASDQTNILNAAANSAMAKFYNGAQAELYYNNTKRLETTNTGVTITGGHTGTIIAGDFTLDNQSQAGRDVFFDQSADRFQFKDNLRASFGDDHDLMIYHDTNHSYIYDAGTGDLKIQTNGAKIQLGKDDGETCANFIPDGAVELYHNNVKKLNTFDSGVVVSGDIQFYDGNELQMGSSSDFHIGHDGSTNVIDAAQSHAISFRRGGSEQFFIGNAEFKGGDSKKIKLGTDDDFHLFHDGTYNYIDCVNDRQLRIVNDTQGANEVMITATPNDGVELFYNGSEKFNTGDNGCTVKNGGINIQRQGVAHAGAIYWAGFGDTNHMLWHDYFDNPNGTRGTGNGFDGIKWNVYAGIHFYKGNEAETIASLLADGACKLYFNNGLRFETSSPGATVYGSLTQTSDILFNYYDSIENNNESNNNPNVKKIIHVNDSIYENYLAENFASAVIKNAENYSHIVCSANTFGKNLMPRIAALLDTSQVSDIIKVISADTFLRPIYAGNAFATVKSNDKKKCITIRPTSFDPAPTSGGSAEIVKVDAGAVSYTHLTLPTKA